MEASLKTRRACTAGVLIVPVRCLRAVLARVVQALKLAPRGMGPPILKSIREAVSDTGG